MNYGLPYKGSKNKLAERIVRLLPKRKHFIDLFCGGCAVSHAAMVMKKYEHIHINDINPMCPELFKRATAGMYREEKRWISREDFAKLRDTDPYVRFCWSFGNNGNNYLYSVEVEPWKKALHYARVYGDTSLLESFGIKSSGSSSDIKAHHDEYKQKYIRWWLSKQEYSAEELDALIAKCKGQIAASEEELRQYLLRGLESSGLTRAEVGRRLGTQMEGHYFGRSQWSFPTKEHYDKMRTFMPALDKDYNEVIGLHRLWQSLQSLESLQSLQSLESLERLQRLQSLQSLQSLERLERLERLTASAKSYEAVEIPKDSVIYCDIPYEGTDGYGVDFDYERFYDWAERQTEPVFISSYQLPPERFDCIQEYTHRSLYSGTANFAATERVFVPKAQKIRGDTGKQLTLFE